MNIATIPRRGGTAQRMQVIDPLGDTVFEATIGTLPDLLGPGDVVVVNDAATIPASLRGRIAGHEVEVRLAGPPEHELWPAVLLGAGDWRTDTDRREAPPEVAIGDALVLDDGTVVEIAGIYPLSSRHVALRFPTDLAAAWSTIFRVGRPIQYAYMQRDVLPSEVQTRYAGRPWAVEMPSAGRPIGIDTLVALRRRGVKVVALTHAAGLSATGDAHIDAALPLPERYEIPAETANAIARAKATGGRVVAVGTSVVRALEASASMHTGRCVAGRGVATIILGPSTRRAVVDAVLAGVHEPGTSHHALLGAFAPPDLLARAHELAVATGLTIHEFGDSTLVLPGAATHHRRAA